MVLNTPISINPVSAQEVGEAIANCQEFFRSSQFEDGYWWARLEANPTMEAEYLLMTHFLGKRDDARWRKISNYLLQKQSDDGSWGQYYDAAGDLSTSVECYFALKLAGQCKQNVDMAKCEELVATCDAIAAAFWATKGETYSDPLSAARYGT